MSLRDLTEMHLRALSNAACAHGWAHRPEGYQGDMAVLDAISDAAGAAVLRILRLWEAQREVTDAQTALDAANRRMHVAQRRLAQISNEAETAQQSSPTGAQAWQ